MKKDLSSTIYLAMYVMIILKVIDFSHLGFLDVCILVLFAVMVGQKLYNHFRRS